jgi:hypothetical protein
MRSSLTLILALGACTHERSISTIHTLTNKTVTVETYKHEKVRVLVE